MQNMLIATDLSKDNQYILKRAIRLALNTRAKLHIFHVISTSHMSGNASDIYSARQAADTHMKSLIERYTKQAELDYSIHIESLGRVRDLIQEYARKLDADLIIIGCSQRFEDSFSGVLTRSEHIITQAQRPVLVVRNPEIIDYHDIFIDAKNAIAPLSMLQPICKFCLAARMTMTLPYHPSFAEKGFLAWLINKWNSYKSRRTRKQIERMCNRYGFDRRRLTLEDGEQNAVPQPSIDLLVLPCQKSDLMKPEFDSSVRHLLHKGTYDILFSERG